MTKKADSTEVKPSKTEFHVYRGEDLVRTYSVELHGKEAAKLAEEFISHNADCEIR